MRELRLAHRKWIEMGIMSQRVLTKRGGTECLKSLKPKLKHAREEVSDHSFIR